MTGGWNRYHRASDETSSTFSTVLDELTAFKRNRSPRQTRYFELLGETELADSFLWVQLKNTPFSEGAAYLAGWTSEDDSARAQGMYEYEYEKEEPIVIIRADYTIILTRIL